MKQQIEWRRDKVQELAVKGFLQIEISRMLAVPKATISRDISFLKQQSQEEIRKHIQDKLPYEYLKCLQGLESIIKEAWIIATKADTTGNIKEKLQSLQLAKDAYKTKMELLIDNSLINESITRITIWIQQEQEKLLVAQQQGGQQNTGDKFIRDTYHLIDKYKSREDQLEQWNQLQLEEEELDRKRWEESKKQGMKIDGAGVSKNRDDYEKQEERNLKIQRMLERYKNETITE